MIGSLCMAAGAGYLLGSLPFGFLVARSHGVDIFKEGSGNPGATNVRRVLGSKAGNLVLALDALKGAVAASWSLLSYTEVTLALPGGLGGPVAIAGQDWRLLGLAGIIGAVLGHSFSLFTRFKGGKGVATTAGGMVVLMPVSCLIAGGVWLIIFYATRYVSLGSILAALTLAVAGWLRGNPVPLNMVVTALSLFVIFRHRENIARLMQGTESKFVRKAPPQA